MKKMKAFQIDLARQIETVEKVYEIFDFAHLCGYDTVVMYLEDRIKTPSYPYPDDKECYTVQQAKDMVKYAEKLGIELIPVVSNFGHVERFLRHKELSHLAELRGDIPDFFGDKQSEHRDVCPSLPEAYEFFDRYITEVAEIFPSEYFHVGLDENFNVGICEKCREKKKHEIFTQHILHSHKLLKSLSKRMMMWEDMFEMCPESLEAIPKDIVMCVWNYRYISDGMVGHLNGSLREDLIDKFLSKGFDVLCCAHTNISNVDSYIDFAKRHDSEHMGFLFTIWELGRDQFEFMFPFLSYASLRFDGEKSGSDTLCKAIRRVFPEGNDTFILAAAQVMQFFLNGGQHWHYPESFEYNYLPDRIDSMNLMSRSIALDMLENSVPEIYKNHPSYVMLRDNCRDHVFNYKLLYEHQKLFEHLCGLKKSDPDEMAREIASIADEIDTTRKNQEKIWNECRCGIEYSELFLEKYKPVIEFARKLSEMAKNAVFGEKAVATVSFFVPDPWNIPVFRVDLIYDDGSKYTVCDRSVKQVNLELKTSSVTVNFILPDKRIPVAVKLGGRGYGGAGYNYISIVCDGKLTVPYAVGDITGSVTHPENLLTNDTSWCYMGEEKVLRGVMDYNLTRRDNNVILFMK